jgi:hypothetical protein
VVQEGLQQLVVVAPALLLSCVVDETRRRLLGHELDGSAGTEASAADVKARQEVPLKEIFERMASTSSVRRWTSRRCA